MGIISVTTFSSDTESVTRTKLNGLVSNLVTEFNGNIDNNNIKSAAGIVYSKLSLGTSIVNADIATAAAIVSTKIDLGTVSQSILITKATTAANLVLTNTGTGPPLRLTASTAPASPTNGDIWYDGTNLSVRLAGTTKVVTVS